MPVYIFLQLRIWLQEKMNLKASEYVELIEKLAMIVEKVSRGLKNQVVQETF